MRPTTPFLLSAAALFLTAAAAPTRAQSQQTQQPATTGTTASPTPDTSDPLAEAARKARAKEAAEGKPKHVLTNDDLPNNGAPATPKAAAADAEANANLEDAGAGQGQDKDSNDPKSEKYWRKQFADARAKLAKAEQELDVLQRELNKNQVQYYPDPQKALTQQYTREDINEGAAKINVKKAEVESLRQHISDLEDDLRKSGGDPGWAR
jgi:chromosome segregation ATPase